MGSTWQARCCFCGFKGFLGFLSECFQDFIRLCYSFLCHRLFTSPVLGVLEEGLLGFLS